jgi:hypothetical protein
MAAENWTAERPTGKNGQTLFETALIAAPAAIPIRVSPINLEDTVLYTP